MYSNKEVTQYLLLYGTSDSKINLDQDRRKFINVTNFTEILTVLINIRNTWVISLKF